MRGYLPLHIFASGDPLAAHDTSSGLERAFLDNRERLLRFLRARGAGEGAEDLVQELWLKIAAARPGPVANPIAYLYRSADLLMIDRYRADRQARQRERDWTDATGGSTPGVSDAPSPERALIAADEARNVAAMLDALGPRVSAIFRRHRVDGVPQRQVAAEFGVSLSTVESDLRLAYRALARAKDTSNEA